MTSDENLSRAQKMVSDWPSWKKDVSLTKHSATRSNVKAGAPDHKAKGANTSAPRVNQLR